VKTVKRTTMLVIAGFAVLALTLAGCEASGSGGKAMEKASAVATSTAAQPEATRVQALIAQCLPKGNALTKAGRNAIAACAVPPAHRAAFKTCLLSAAGKDREVTAAGRKQLKEDAEHCVMVNQ